MGIAYEDAEKILTEIGERSGRYYEISDYNINRNSGIKLVVFDCSKSDVQKAIERGEEEYYRFGRSVKIISEKALMLSGDPNVIEIYPRDVKCLLDAAKNMGIEVEIQ